MWSQLCPIVLLLAAPTVFANAFCSQAAYGNPAQADCLQALSTLPYGDQYARYFIEDPLFSTQSYSSWQAFSDPRPRRAQTQSVQLPKFWSYGSCNIAITTYPRLSTTPLTSWSNIYYTGLQALNICLATHQGGSAIVGGVGGVAALTLFFWVNGAPFQEMVNAYTSAGFPRPFDPINPLLLVNGSEVWGNSSSKALYSAYPQNQNGPNYNRTLLTGVAAPVNSS